MSLFLSVASAALESPKNFTSACDSVGHHFPSGKLFLCKHQASIFPRNTKSTFDHYIYSICFVEIRELTVVQMCRNLLYMQCLWYFAFSFLSH